MCCVCGHPDMVCIKFSKDWRKYEGLEAKSAYVVKFKALELLVKNSKLVTFF